MNYKFIGAITIDKIINQTEKYNQITGISFL